MSDTQKHPLSVIVLTKNEEKRLPNCLESVAWASDIVVLDDDSTDETETIAQKYHARFIRRKMDIEGRHRNFGYSLAKEKWILSLDADERVSPELTTELQNCIKNNENKVNGYTIPRRNYIGNYWIRYGGWYPSQQVKLFKKEAFRYREDEVHPVAFMHGTPGRLNGDIIHYSYDNFSDFISKLNHQTTLEAQKWVRSNKSISLTHALWKTLDRFFRSFIRKKGYKDGFIGLMVSVFASLYQILSYAKYWEIKQRKS